MPPSIWVTHGRFVCKQLTKRLELTCTAGTRHLQTTYTSRQKSTRPSSTPPGHEPPSPPPLPPAEVVLYRWPTMRHFRLISRLKLYQVSAMFLMLPPISYMYLTGSIEAKSVVYATLASAGTAAVLFILSHYFRRVVGEMTYITARQCLRISTLTFAGRRRDLEFNIDDVVPYLDSQTRVGGAIQRLEINNCPEIFLYSLKYGRVLDFERLRKCLKM